MTKPFLPMVTDVRGRPCHLGRFSILQLVLLALLSLSFATPAAAQGFNLFNWFQQMAPRPRQPQGYDYRMRQQPRHRVKPRVQHPVAKAAPKPTVPPSFFVAVLGDSLGQMLDQGLTEELADRPEIAVLRKTHDSSGLVRDDFYDWPKAVKDLLASGQKINVAVILIGSNDHQPLRVDGVTYEPGSPKWAEIYAQRVETICKLFHDAKIPLLWVGLPIMKSDRLSSEMASFNDIYRDHVAKAGATFVDIWDAFGDENGRFSVYGPNVTGQVVRLRTSDGIHFTKAGARKLAQFVETEIRQLYEASKPKDDATLAKIETTAPAGTSVPNAIKAAPVKPPIGPVLPLTGPVLAPEGTLATSPASTNEAHSLAEQTFVKGDALAPKPGRADDFAWPPH
ncbi:MAG: DUF459 domain-containing protein [Beijerinckiaceae bacterium]|nr:MAG: DUF459 domain-containing protein [Beijerinckiaceae bacterium]